MNKKYLVFTGLGFELLGFVLSGLYVGSVLDRTLGTEDLWKGIIVISFIVVWFAHFFLMVRKILREEGKK